MKLSMHSPLTLFAPPELRQEYSELKKKLASLLGAASELQALLDSDELNHARIKAAQLGELATTLGAALDADRDQTPPHEGRAKNKHELEANILAQKLLSPGDNIRLSIPETIAVLTPWARQALHAWATARRMNSYRMRALAACFATIALLAGIYGAINYATGLHAREIELDRLSQFDVDLASPHHVRPLHFKVGGLLLPENDGALHWCWGLGPKTLIAFVLQKPQQITVSAALHNPIAGQIVTFNGNGTLQSFTLERSQVWPLANSEFTFTFKGDQGLNTLSIEYTDWNHKRLSFAPNDPNQYAVAFQRLVLTTKKIGK